MPLRTWREKARRLIYATAADWMLERDLPFLAFDRLNARERRALLVYVDARYPWGMRGEALSGAWDTELWAFQSLVEQYHANARIVAHREKVTAARAERQAQLARERMMAPITGGLFGEGALVE